MEPTLLILAAGMGSRYGGLKQIDPMGPSGETVLDYSIYDALRAGFGRVVFVIRPDFEQAFRDAVGRRYESKVDVGYVFQQLELIPEPFTVPPDREKPWGTAHAIWCARNEVRKPFLAINADDFYGFDAYRQLGDFLSNVSLDVQPAQFAMAGFRLAKTVSDFGSVARGVCKVDEDGRLRRIEELMGIERTSEGIVNREPGKPDRRLSSDQPVSMNFWGFTPAVFGFIEELLVDFLRTKGSEMKSEFYIPLAVADMIAAGKAEVRVIDTTSQWFGVTYKEDKALVVKSLARLIESGDYPASLSL